PDEESAEEWHQEAVRVVFVVPPLPDEIADDAPIEGTHEHHDGKHDEFHAAPVAGPSCQLVGSETVGLHDTRSATHPGPPLLGRFKSHLLRHTTSFKVIAAKIICQ